MLGLEFNPDIDYSKYFSSCDYLFSAIWDTEGANYLDALVASQEQLLKYRVAYKNYLPGERVMVIHHDQKAAGSGLNSRQSSGSDHVSQESLQARLNQDRYIGKHVMTRRVSSAGGQAPIDGEYDPSMLLFHVTEEKEASFSHLAYGYE